jgi:hypothetical protein
MKVWELFEDRGDKGGDIEWRRGAMQSNPSQHASSWELQKKDNEHEEDNNWVVKAGNTIIAHKKTRADAEKKFQKLGRITVTYQKT